MDTRTESNTPTLTDMTAHFEQEADAFLQAMQPERYEAEISKQVNEFLAPRRWKGLDHGDPEEVASVERQERQLWDVDLRARVARLDADERDLVAQVMATLRAAEDLPDDPAVTQSTNDTVRLLGELTKSTRTEAATRRLTGRTLRYVTDQYIEATATPEREAARRETIQLIDAGRDNGWRDLNLQADPHTDALALMELQRAIRDRRTARAAAAAPEAVACLARIEARRRSATFDLLRRHVRSGRGVALKPAGRHMVLGAARPMAATAI
jgi:hypothetical protein